MTKKVVFYLEDIIDSISKLESFVKDMHKKDFSKDIKTQDAVVRRREISGEAVKNIPDELKKSYPNVEWRAIAGTRDVLIHAYSKVDISLIWDIVKKDLPGFKKQIKEIFKVFSE